MHECLQINNGGTVTVLEEEHILTKRWVRCLSHEEGCEFHPDKVMFSCLNTRGAAELWKVLAVYLLCL